MGVYLPHQPLREGETLVADESAYEMYHTLKLMWPCLSFDFFADQGSLTKNYPLEIRLVAGSQAAKPQQNYLWIIKCTNLFKTSSNDNLDRSTSSPKVESYEIPLKDCINRVRVQQYQSASVVAALSEAGELHIYNIPNDFDPSAPISASSESWLSNSINSSGSEGYALSWSEKSPGVLAYGNITGKIGVVTGLSAFDKERHSVIELRGHESSVEDVKWSPVEPSVMISGSSDKTIRVWDLRVGRDSQLHINAHDSDVNALDWNKVAENLVASGAESGDLRIWDIRTWASGASTCPGQLSVPASEFKWHTDAITSVQWKPGDASTLVVSGSDNHVSIWDFLAYEDDAIGDTPDSKPIQKDDDLQQIPPQLLFTHQGQNDIKEARWHPRLDGVLASTAIDGIDIFETINSGQ